MSQGPDRRIDVPPMRHPARAATASRHHATDSAGLGGRRLALIGIAAALAACASPAVQPWSAGSRLWRGRFALATAAAGIDQPAEEVQGRFVLQVQESRIALSVYSPFGQTMAQLEERPGHAWLKSPDGSIRTATSAEDLLEESLGWRLPVRELPRWLETREAIPADPASPWQVQVLRRFEDGSARVILARWPASHLADEPVLQVRIVIEPR